MKIHLRNITNLLLILIFTKYFFISTPIFSITIETTSGKVIENVTLGEERESTIEFYDKDGIVTVIRKDNIKSYFNDKPSGNPIKSTDENLKIPITFKFNVSSSLSKIGSYGKVDFGFNVISWCCHPSSEIT